MNTINFSHVLNLVLVSSLLTTCNFKNLEQIQIGFENDSSDLTDSLKTVNSFSKKDNFFVLNYVGSYDDKIQWLQDYFNQHAGVDFKPNPSGCSVFYASNDSNKNYLGQNVDLPACSVLFGKYSSNEKYKSFSFSRIEDLETESKKGLNRSINPSKLTDFQKTCVLFFPFYAVGGMNERGLAVGIAGITSQVIKETKNRKPIFVTNLIRQILDNCKTIDDAVQLSHDYYFYDHSLTTNSHHLLIGDSTGRSLIIEYKNGKMEYVYPNQKFQLFTNNYVIDNSIDNLNECWRYKSINDQLSKRNSRFDIQDYLKILDKAKNNTNWSVVYDLKNKQGIFTIYGSYSKQYKFGFK